MDDAAHAIIDVAITEVTDMPDTVGEDGKKHFAYGETKVFKKQDQVVLTKSDCKHEFIPDHEDETDYYIAMTCRHCPQGYLQKK